MRSADEVISQFWHLLPSSCRLGLGCPVGAGKMQGHQGRVSPWAHGPGALEEKLMKNVPLFALLA